MKNFYVILAIAVALFCSAEVQANPASQNCRMEETANVSISLTGTETDMTKIKSAIDKKGEEIKALAVEGKIGEIELQNYNYNIYSNNSGAGGCGAGSTGATYQYNASFGYNIKPIDKAAELAALLTSKGYNVSLNVNSYKQCQ